MYPTTSNSIKEVVTFFVTKKNTINNLQGGAAFGDFEVGNEVLDVFTYDE